MDRAYCYICGSKLEKQEERRWFCPSCKQDYYDNPRPCADLVIFNQDGEVLLGKRAFEPGKGKWDLPGGFIEFNETAEEAALREGEEELGIKPSDLTEPKYVMTYTGKYPWGKETYHILASAYVVKAKKELVITAQDDVEDTLWVKVEDIDTIDLSAPSQKDVVLRAQETINKQ